MDLHDVPSEWKRSIICPIFKKGNASDPSNYRPISLTCCCSKIMESLIVNDLSDFLLGNNLISRQQHGFIKKRSTTSNLLESLNDWTISLSRRTNVIVAYIDFARAFDSICHSKLILKLRSYGISGNLLSWLTSFLVGRMQCVRVGTALSGFPSCI